MIDPMVLNYCRHSSPAIFTLDCSMVNFAGHYIIIVINNSISTTNLKEGNFIVGFFI